MDDKGNSGMKGERHIKFNINKGYRVGWDTISGKCIESIEPDYWGRKTIIEVDGNGTFNLDFYNFTKKDEIELILRGNVSIFLRYWVRLWITDYREDPIKKFDCLPFERRFNGNDKLLGNLTLNNLKKGDKVLLSNGRLFMNEEEEMISEIIE